MKILVTGIKGQLGHDLVKVLSKRNHEVVGVDIEEMDLTIISQIKGCIENTNPEAIIHCGAFTAVDLAEEKEVLCRKINADSVKYIAECAKKLDIPMIYISTDYIFDGSKGVNFKKLDRDTYKEYKEDDAANPINIYGKTKYEGEEYVRNLLDKYYIVRISWVFGENGNNFIDTMIKLSKNRDEVDVVCDQIGSPTYTKDLAPLLADMIETNKYGTYHATNEGFCSWYEFANEIFKVANIDMKVNPTPTNQYPTKAKRPYNSKMSKEKLVRSGFNPLRNWKDALEDYLNNYKK